MVWQDIIITVSQIVFIYALLPQIYSSYKNKKKNISFQTAILTCFGLFATAIAFLTLGFYYSTVMSFISGSCWLVLTVQSLKYK